MPKAQMLQPPGGRFVERDDVLSWGRVVREPQRVAKPHFRDELSATDRRAELAKQTGDRLAAFIRRFLPERGRGAHRRDRARPLHGLRPSNRAHSRGSRRQPLQRASARRAARLVSADDAGNPLRHARRRRGQRRPRQEPSSRRRFWRQRRRDRASAQRRPSPHPDPRTGTGALLRHHRRTWTDRRDRMGRAAIGPRSEAPISTSKFCPTMASTPSGRSRKRASPTTNTRSRGSTACRAEREKAAAFSPAQIGRTTGSSSSTTIARSIACRSIFRA